MTDLASRSTLLEPPAARPAGRRGIRGPVAAIAALAAVVPAMFFRAANDTSWARPVLVGAGILLIGGAVLLWTTRRAVVLGAAVVLALAGVAGTVVAIGAENRAERRAQHELDRWGGADFSYPRARGAILTRAEAQAVPKGLTREQLTARLGEPSATGVQRFRGEPDLRCLAYRSTSKEPASQLLRAFCFRNGRYAELGQW
jgi:hypothetical protein